MESTSGYILHETRDIVIIAVGWGSHGSENEKTGNMIQVYSLYRWMKPTDAIKTGADRAVCFECVHRGDGAGGERSCYVNAGQGPRAVWDKYSRGGYPALRRRDYASVFAGKMVRFGAYGEPVLIPIANMRAIVAVASGWTGYTHRWRRAECTTYRGLLLASVDSVEDQATAAAAGWRTFRVRTPDGSLGPSEIVCPASPEGGKRAQCVRCTLCNGAHGNDVRKSIVIIAHGSGRSHFIHIALIRA